MSTTESIPDDQLSQIMGAINSSRSAVELQIKALQEELKKNKDEVAESVAKKVRRERPPEFRRKGNEKQYKFNEEVLEKFEAAAGEVASATPLTPSLERTKKIIEEGMVLLEDRQKMIRLADRSDFGWDVVSEYQSDELATNSDDEKRISKAEKAAEKKLLKKKKVAAVGKGSKVNRTSDWRPYSKYPMLTARSNWSWNPRVPVGAPPAAGPGQSVRNTRLPGPCFGCGEFGHLRSSCSKVGLASTSKYPLNHEGLHVYVDVDSTLSTVESDELSGECSSESDSEWEVKKRYWEGTELDGRLSGVKGRLCSKSVYWESVIQAPGPVLSIIKQGYILPFVSLPESKSFGNHSSTVLHSQFVTDSIRDLVSHGCVKELSSPPVVCSPLIVVTSRTGKRRLVINLRYVNRYLWKDKFKYEDIRTAMLFFEKDGYLCTFDLKSGYHHIDIHENCQTYLGFQWDSKFYRFTVLPFGLATACYIFTKVLRALVRLWRSKGIKVVLYIDDGIIVAPSFEKASLHSQFIRMSLEEAGFLVNEEKSQWEPRQCVCWLGFVIDLERSAIAIPVDKIELLKDMLSSALENCTLSAKTVASIVGRIISMGLGIGPIARLRTRSLYALLDSRCSWYEELVVSEEAKSELQFWLTNLDHFNGQGIWRSASAVRVVYSDASSSGFGGYIVEHGQHFAHGQWREDEIDTSSTWRELTAVARVLQAVANKMVGHRVRWFTDNQNVVKIVTVGSRKPALQAVAVRIFRLAWENSISLEPEWIPREENKIADYVSRIVDYDDWMLNPEIFRSLDYVWGPHTVDRFASDHNTQLDRFNSRFWNPGCEAVDAFTVDWSGENNWWCPPVSLITRVIRHAESCHSQGTLIVPFWKSAVFWPMICPEGEQFAQFIIDSMVIAPVPGMILPGIAGAQLFKGGVPNTEILALRLGW